jgi:hypothetical protein
MRTSRQHELLGGPLDGHLSPDGKRLVVFFARNVPPEKNAAVHTTFLLRVFEKFPRRVPVSDK